MSVIVRANLVIYADNDAAADAVLASPLIPVKGATAQVVEMSREAHDAAR